MPGLTPDAVLALAPDAASVRAATEIAVPSRWLTLHTDGASLWGHFRGSSGMYQTGVALETPSFTCSCPSSKSPCKHGLGLLLAYTRSPEAFAAAPAPDWLGEWLSRDAARRARRVAHGPVVDVEAQSRRAAQREERIAGGLEDLELWLRDLLRSGLAAAHGKGYAFWDSAAARLVDAQAPGLARRVRALAGVAASGAGWEERLVERLGLLWLLVQAYRRQADLPADARADVRALAGWTVSQDELLAGPGIRDRWLVLGARVEEVDERFQNGRLWLWGSESKRPALLLAFGPAGAPLDLGGRVGTTVDAELVFYPGVLAQRALVKQRHGVTDGVADPLPGHPDLAAAYADYGQKLARHAFTDELPLLLRAVVPQRLGEAWVVRDAAGDLLPLGRRFSDEQRLVALAGGRPVGVFGEWSGRTLVPLGVAAEGRYVGF